MGQTASASVTNSREENLINLIKMLRFVAILSLAASAFTAPQLGLGSSLGSGIGVGLSLGLGSRVGLARTLCTTQVQVQYEQQCVESFDEIVDTTYTEQCEDIITERCQSTSQQVISSSAIVGQDSQIVASGISGVSSSIGIGKREADADAKADADADADAGIATSKITSTGPQCEQQVTKQCQQIPTSSSRKIPKQICTPVEIQVPVKVCGSTYL